jgi:hypothetical protein
MYVVTSLDPHTNQVLFRNNFAVSRDIASLFQSFQSSSAILDPAANPNLFCSKLVIIIKVSSYSHLSDMLLTDV